MGAHKDNLIASEVEEGDRGQTYDVTDPRSDDGDPLGRALIHEERFGW